MRQTTVKEFNSIRFGSGKFEVEDSGGTWHDLGAMRDIQFEEEWDKITVNSDNAGPIVMGIRNHVAALAGSLMEISLEKLSVLRGGLDTYEEDAGGSETEDQVILQGTWKFETWIELDGQNADGTAPTINSVTGSENGALAADNDYNLAIGSNGRWGIVLHEGGTTLATEDQNITVNSTYTPAAKKTLKSGGKQTIEARQVRVTNKNEDGNNFIITIFKATTEEGIVIDFPADHEEDPAMVPVRMQGTMDEDKSTGEQLFMIEDYQNV